MMWEYSFDIEELKNLHTQMEDVIMKISQASPTKQEMNKEEIIKKHPYSISYQESSGFWYTYLPDVTKTNKRRRVKRKSKESLEDAIVEFYTQKAPKKEDLNTLRSIYPRWLKHLEACYTASTTIRRYDCDWNRWLSKDPLMDAPIQELDYVTLYEWANGFVKGNNSARQPLTKKQYYNVCIIIKGCFDLALQKNVIKDNAFLRVKIKKKHFYVPEKPFVDDRDQVFNDEEFPELRKIALEEYYQKRDEVALAVFLISFTGMRAAEACALKWSSFTDDFSRVFVSAQIVKEEKQDANGKWKRPKWIYVNYTKSENGRRSIYIPEDIRGIIAEHKSYKGAESEDEMVFSRANGHYITNNQTYRRTVKYSNKIQTYRKGTHKLRKTYLTALYDGGVHESTLTKIAGQSMDGKVLHIHYLKDRKSEDEVNQKLDELMKFARRP